MIRVRHRLIIMVNGLAIGASTSEWQRDKGFS